MRRGWILAALLLVLTGWPGGAAEVPQLLQDIVTRPVQPNGIPGLPEAFVQVNDRLVFSTPSGGFDFSAPGILWSTDGTPEGTHAVSTAICPAFCESITPVATWPGTVLLRTTERPNPSGSDLKMRLWRTDGTPAGTLPLTAATETTQILGAFVAGPSPDTGLFYFFDCSVAEEQKCQLWRSDGTLPGTHAVTDLEFSFVTPMAAAGRFFFLARSAEETGLWVTDGTADGTRLLATVPLFFGTGMFAATPSRLFFTTDDQQLWVSDGTPAGTRLVYEGGSIQFLQPAGEGVYFLSGLLEAQIWHSDGTESGTRRLVDLPDGDEISSLLLGRAGNRWVFSYPYYEGPLWAVDGDFSHPAPLTCPEGCPQVELTQPFSQASPPGRILFAGHDSQHGWELWASDGTGRGTRRLTDVCPGPCDGIDLHDRLASRRLGKTYFRAFGSSGPELWVTDGTLGSTRRLATGYPSDLGILRGLVFFGISNSRGTTSELWVTDGTPAGQRRVATLRTLAGSYPRFAPLANGALIFAAEDKDGLQTLWRSNGTPERTFPLPGFEASDLFELARVGELTFFTVPSPQSIRERVWRTDGTARGTFPVARTPSGSFVDLNIAWNGKYLFAVSGPGSDDGCAYWLSDGTPLGTREIVPEVAGSRCPTGLHALGSRFLFIERVTGDGGLTPQVFVSDGTAAGTRQISNIPGPREFIDTDLAEINGVVFFRLYEQNGQGVEVWRTDGSPEGTFRLPLGLSQADALFAFQGSLYLTAAVDAESPLGFWRVPLDGRPPILLTTASPTFDPQAEFKHAFTPAGGRLFFAARDETNGAEFWVTDGTPEGTRRVRDIQPGTPSSSPDGLTAAGSRVFFVADDGVSGRELWVSNGTEEGTRLVLDVNPGLLSSSPTELTVGGGYLFFGADDGRTGVEPWALRLEP